MRFTLLEAEQINRSANWLRAVIVKGKSVIINRSYRVQKLQKKKKKKKIASARAQASPRLQKYLPPSMRKNYWHKPQMKSDEAIFKLLGELPSGLTRI